MKKSMVKKMVGVTMVFILAVVILCGCTTKKSSKTRSGWTQCNYKGEAQVFSAGHNNGVCVSDGDGYYWPTIGHHHHR